MYRINQETTEKLNRIKESGIEFSYTAMSNFIEKVELPKVELKNTQYGELPDGVVIAKSEYNEGTWFISWFNEAMHNRGGITISDRDVIKSISDFNEKCSLLFGFELVEAVSNGSSNT